MVSNCLDDDSLGWSVRRLVVLAASSSDGSTDLAAVFIHINDVTDHPARFTTGRKEAIVAEDAPRGSVVARIPPVFHQHHTGNPIFDTTVTHAQETSTGNCCKFFLLQILVQVFASSVQTGAQ